jgi:transcriptional regulator with XRE-family HTH domain
MTTRFEQRTKKRLRNADILEGYKAADAQLQLLDALDSARRVLGVSQGTLADALGKTQSAVSQFFGGETGVTIDRLADYLAALNLQARIEIVSAKGDDPPLVVETRVVQGT